MFKNLKIAVDLVEGGTSNQTDYIIRLKSQDTNWVVYRRYSEFRTLRDAILKESKQHSDGSSGLFYTSVEELQFPSKRVFGSKKESVIQERAVELDNFLQKLLPCVINYQENQSNSKFCGANEKGHEEVVKMLDKFLRFSTKDDPRYTPTKQPSNDRTSPPTSNASSSSFLSNGSVSSKKIYSTSSSMSSEDSKNNAFDEPSVPKTNVGEKSRLVLRVERELRRVLDVNEVEILLRYIDRFVSRAYMKHPGCYRISPSNDLEVDVERFYEELEVDFPSLPAVLRSAFINREGQWRIPPQTARYLRKKWKNFQDPKSNEVENDDEDYDANEGSDEYIVINNSRDQLIQHAEDIDSGDYELENADELEQMQAEGIAGKDQLIKLRRHFADAVQLKHQNNGETRIRPRNRSSSSPEALNPDLLKQHNQYHSKLISKVSHKSSKNSSDRRRRREKSPQTHHAEESESQRYRERSRDKNKHNSSISRSKSDRYNPRRHRSLRRDSGETTAVA